MTRQQRSGAGLPLAALALATSVSVCGASAQASTITQNSGFEAALSSWSTTGNAGSDTANPHTGSLDAFLGNGTLKQVLATVPGATYSLDFFLAADFATLQNALPPSSFNASLNVALGGDVLTSPDIRGMKFVNKGATAGEYFEFTFTDIAAAASSDLVFTGTQASTNPGLWYIDDVTVTCTADCSLTGSIPEPSVLQLLFGAIVAWPLAKRLRRRAPA